MHKKEKSKRKPMMSTTECTLLTFLLFVALLMICAKFWSYSAATTDAVAGAVDIDEYKALLLRANELTKKYKSLTGSGALPVGLSLSIPQIESDTKSPTDSLTTPVSSSMAKDSTAQTHSGSENVVLGMAQDTDSKNLVRCCLFHQCNY